MPEHLTIDPGLGISVSGILRRIGLGNPISSGVINEAAKILDDTELLLGRLAECFGDDEVEFSEIGQMLDRIRGEHRQWPTR